MRKIYLYHKISPLGLNYLGKTVKDPYKYKGSGKRWKLHLRKHNIIAKDIKTIILFESYDVKEIRERGLYYSNLYNIVDSRTWANLIPESGDGCFGVKQTKEHREKLMASLKNRPPVSEATRLKIGRGHKGKVHSAEARAKISAARKNKVAYYPTQATKDKLSLAKTGKSRKGVTVVSLDGTQIFNSVRELAKIINVNEITLSKHLSKKTNKYPYKYLDDYVPPIRKGVKGRIVSQETRLNMSKAKKIKKVINIETKEIFNSVVEAALTVGMKSNTLASGIRNKRKNCKFMYYEQ